MLVSTALNDRFFFIHWFIPPKHVLNVPVLPINTGPSKSNRWLSGVEAIFSGKAAPHIVLVSAALNDRGHSVRGK